MDKRWELLQGKTYNGKAYHFWRMTAFFQGLEKQKVLCGAGLRPIEDGGHFFLFREACAFFMGTERRSGDAARVGSGGSRPLLVGSGDLPQARGFLKVDPTEHRRGRRATVIWMRICDGGVDAGCRGYGRVLERSFLGRRRDHEQTSGGGWRLEVWVIS